MPELDRELALLGRELDYPDTPDLATAVAARLSEPPARRFPLPSLVRPRRALALALVGLLVLAGTVFAAVPGVRHAVLEALGLRGATVERTTTLPAVPEARRLDLGSPVTLDAARRAVAFRVLVPAALGRPGAVHLRRKAPGGEVLLSYRPGPGLPRARPSGLGLLVSEFRGDLSPEYVGKVAPQATTVERLRVGPHRAVWIGGAPHLFFYRPPGGGLREESLRLAANVLLVQRGRVLVRLEGAMSRRRAVAIARSLR